MEQKTKKRSDVKQRFDDNKSKSFITVKMKC